MEGGRGGRSLKAARLLCWGSAGDEGRETLLAKGLADQLFDLLDKGTPTRGEIGAADIDRAHGVATQCMEAAGQDLAEGRVRERSPHRRPCTTAPRSLLPPSPVNNRPKTCGHSTVVVGSGGSGGRRQQDSIRSGRCAEGAPLVAAEGARLSDCV